MGKMSREKGKRGEREVAALIREYGFDGARGRQYKGTDDSPDIAHNMDCLGPDEDISLYIEVKYREQLNLHETMRQAVVEKRVEQTPAIFHRKNGTGWLVTLRAEDFMHIMRALSNC